MNKVLGGDLGARALTLVAVVSVVAGVLLGLALKSADKQPGRDLDLPDLVKTQQDTVLSMEATVNGLSNELQKLTDTGLSTAVAAAPKALTACVLSGPGVTVTLSDAPKDFDVNENVSANDLVVHQQDVDAVMNALWRGGAEAMSVQGVRITATTPVRCIGNVILIGVRSFAPPYRVQAVGDVDRMRESLTTDPLVDQFRQAAARYQMGWNVEVESEIKVPWAHTNWSLKFAVAEKNT